MSDLGTACMCNNQLNPDLPTAEVSTCCDRTIVTYQYAGTLVVCSTKCMRYIAGSLMVEFSFLVYVRMCVQYAFACVPQRRLGATYSSTMVDSSISEAECLLLRKFEFGADNVVDVMDRSREISRASHAAYSSSLQQ